MKRIAETPTDYARPYRPWPVAAFNALARRTPRSGSLRRLNADRMLANARKRTQLRDLGDERCLTALRVLVRAINDEAELTPTGVLLQRRRIEGALANRLRVRRLLKRHPEIQDLELGKVVLIAGLQRTGTTALHRLIASHPDMRALMSWEALNPAPLPGEGERGFGRRLRRARLAERTITYLAPAFFAVHPISHDAPEEDILLLDLSFSQAGPARFVDVLYADLMRDPGAQLERIYRQAGIPFRTEAFRAAARARERNPQHRHGRHIYNAADFGLDRAEVEERFAAYRARYRISNELSP